jgi:hypothetical protein
MLCDFFCADGTRPWKVTIIDQIPLSTMGTDGLYTHTKLTPCKMGENTFTRQAGTVDNEGYCTGQGMVYHGLQYSRERATITIRIKLLQRNWPSVNIEISGSSGIH